MSKIVVALGGNALGNSPEEQIKIVKDTAKALVDIVEHNHQLTICHGNGPQVGMINLQFETAQGVNDKLPVIDLPECVAMSQGYIGFHLQQAIQCELASRSLQHNVVSLITQTLVDENDVAFKNPSKPIGNFYDQKVAEKLAADNNWTIKEDSGRGWRRVVASPQPQDILEKKLIKELVDNNSIVIAAGGGGIPVIKTPTGLRGIPAVVDKDFASVKLASAIDADKLIILTAVDKVMINYNKPNQQALDKLTLAEAQKYIDEEQFAPGSMLPKVQAAMQFVQKNPDKESIIASLANAKAAISGLTGTKIINK